MAPLLSDEARAERIRAPTTPLLQSVKLPRHPGGEPTSLEGAQQETASSTHDLHQPTLEQEQQHQQPPPGPQREGSLLLQLGAASLLISPFFFWGTSMVAMKVLAPHTSPLFVSSVRLLPAGAALVAWAASRGKRQPDSWQAWAAISAFGLVDGTAFQGFLAEGLQRTSAGLGSVIIDSQPLTVAVLAALLFEERLNALGVAGLITGVAGLTLLEVPEQAIAEGVQALRASVGGASPASLTDLSQAATAAVSHSSQVTSEIASTGSVWDSGEFWMLLAAQSMAVGTVMVRWVSKYVDPVMATGWHMIIGGLPLLALSLVQEGDVLLPRLQQATGFDLLLLAYVSLLGSAASYGVFFYNASKGNLTALCSLTFLTPMFAAGTGYLALDETLTPLQLTGAAITLGAVYLINNKPAESASNT